ncbi:hypothetical protein EDD11_004265 [Mortierella claussenii]|nr:hypothetical protein EDD11_004265 [Mortierella claussenii]
MHIENKVAVVTGASSGIGRAVSKRLIDLGAKVVLADIDIERGKQAEAEMNLGKPSKVAHFVRCDVGSSKDLVALIAAARSQFQRFDILINNAGIVEKEHLFMDPEEHWRQVASTNLLAAIDGTRLAVDAFRLEKKAGRLEQGGVVINTSSVAGMEPFLFRPVYTATKHGLIGFTRSFKKELLPTAAASTVDSRAAKTEPPPAGVLTLYEVLQGLNVRVNAVAPTLVDTALIAPTRDTAMRIQNMIPMSIVVDAFVQLIENDQYSGDVAATTQKGAIKIVQFDYDSKL